MADNFNVNNADTESYFQKAIQKRKETKEADDQRRMGNFSVEEIKDIHYMSFVDQEEVVFRPVGLPAEVRTSPYDSKIIFWSRILNQTKKYHTDFIWKTIDTDVTTELDPDWILMKFYDSVMERHWAKFDTPQDGKDEGWIYEHNGHDIFTHVAFNRSASMRNNIKIQFKGRKRVVMPGISRMDNWCKENKSCIIVTSSRKAWMPKRDGSNQNIVYFTDYGIPYEKCYTKIMERVVEYYKHWNIDLVITKKADTMEYDVYDINDKYVSEKSKRIGTDAPLTEEELMYARPNIDDKFPVTSYGKIKNTVGDLIKQWDGYRGLKLFDELLDLYDREQYQKEQEKKETQPTGAVNIPYEEKAPAVGTPVEQKVEAPAPVQEKKEEVKTPAPAPEAKKEEAPRRQEAPAQGIPLEDACKSAFPMWDKITENDRKVMLFCVKGFKEGVPVYGDTEPDGQALKTFPCNNDKCVFVGTNVQTITPSAVWNCPVCGANFQS